MTTDELDGLGCDNHIKQKVVELEKELKFVRDITLAQRTVIDNLSIENRAQATTIQNTVIAFGAMKERLDYFSNTCRTQCGDSATKLDKLFEVSGTRLADFNALCIDRRQAAEVKINASVEAVKVRVATIEDKMMSNDTAHGVRISELENKITNTLYFVLVSLIGWVIKLLYPQLGS
jgi:hypothetical protein